VVKPFAKDGGAILGLIRVIRGMISSPVLNVENDTVMEFLSMQVVPLVQNRRCVG